MQEVFVKIVKPIEVYMLPMTLKNNIPLSVTSNLASELNIHPLSYIKLLQGLGANVRQLQ